MRFIWPCTPHFITRDFHVKDCEVYYNCWHAATDIVHDFDGGPGDPIQAVCAGTLYHNPFLDRYGGWTCWVDTPDGWRISYYHFMQPSHIPSGTAVKQGQVIGYMGTTGVSFGVHLHLMFWHKMKQSPEALARPNGWWAHDPENYLGVEDGGTGLEPEPPNVKEEVEMFLARDARNGMVFVIGPKGKRHIDDGVELQVYQRKLGFHIEEFYAGELDTLPDG